MNPGGYGGGGGGYPPSGGGYPPGGGMPPAGGGGGWGPPPGGAPPQGGGWGPPPGGAPPQGGGGGWGQPPVGGAPGMGAYAPPAGGYGPPPGQPPMGMGGAAGGQRVVFNGEGGKLFGTYLLYGAAPMVVGYIILAIFGAIGAAIDKAAGAGGVLAIITAVVGGLAMIAIVLGASVVFTNKFYAFYYESLVLDGQPCQYTGTPAELAKIYIINQILTSLTCGIYTPWAMVRMKEFVHSKVLVNGQPNRLTFHGDPASLLGTYILGAILTSLCFIYAPWFINDIFAFMWENTKLDGRPYQFRKDPGGFLGTYLLAMLLSLVTCYIYLPWGICNILKWEADRVA